MNDLQKILKNIKSAKNIEVNIKGISQKQLKNYIDELAFNYHNGESIITDRVYDLLVEYYEKTYGPLKTVGAPPISKGLTKVTLPYYMGSLDKVKDEKALTAFIKKYKTSGITISKKIDGISALLLLEKGVPVSLYKRGDGIEGSDISHLLQYITLPKKIPHKLTAIRGELVIYDKDFEDHAERFKNARNMASGITSATKTVEPELCSLLHFIAYTIFDTDMIPTEQFSYLKAQKFETPYHSTISIEDIPTVINVNALTDLLLKLKSESAYKMDGLVLSADIAPIWITGEDPKFMKAFKTDSEFAQVTVVDVEWNKSKHGYLKPRVQIQPVDLEGVTIEWATGHNAKFIEDNKIGKGATIIITRSGDVIPYIKKVVKSAKKASLPNSTDIGGWHWNESKVDILLDDIENDANVDVKRITNFFSALDIKHLGEATVQKLYDNDYNTISKILTISPEDFKDIPNLGLKSGKNICDEIMVLYDKGVPIGKIASAGGCFGIGLGLKKLTSVFDTYTLKELLDMDKKDFNLEGFADKTIDKLFDHLETCSNFIAEMRDIGIIVIEKDTESTNNKLRPLNEHTIVFTGFRDGALEEKIVQLGGRVTTSVSKKTTIVIAKDVNATSEKVKTALKNGTTIVVDKATFVRDYLS